MTKLYRHPLSGHAHRAELFLSFSNCPGLIPSDTRT